MGIAKLLLGILGNVTAVALFVAPLPTFWKIRKMKSTQGFSGLPYVFFLFNCMLWVFYGLPFVRPHSTLIITINSAGCAIEILYILAFLTYAPKVAKLALLRVLAVLSVAFAVVSSLTVTLSHSHKERTTIIGSVCVVVATGMYLSPLSVMKLVVQTRSVEFMPILLSLGVLANSIVWALYAVVTKDIFVGIPNVLGILSGIVQMVLYIVYRNARSDASSTDTKAVATNNNNNNTKQEQV